MNPSREQGLEGSIPARAGEPPPVCSAVWCNRVYPRTCGGTLATPPAESVEKGLSPHVRGNHGDVWASSVDHGSIPARAGEPISRDRVQDQRRVYPRTCGGTDSRAHAQLVHTGLSPHVRGNRAERLGGLCREGSIPARAGEPATSIRGRSVTRVYPRTCGGTSSCPVRDLHARGLSPHVRGNLGAGSAEPVLTGSIPARAGEPVFSCFLWFLVWVYPRTCGGTTVDARCQRRSSGLSPHVRGNRDAAAARLGRWGSIPARAGEPSRPSSATCMSGVYPRTCGGTNTDSSRWSRARGLSPHVRGNLTLTSELADKTGSIPARAGEPL